MFIKSPTRSLLGLVPALLLGASLAFTAGGAAADSVQLAPDHPDRYTVEVGDTLWHIAGRFLKDPWRWKEVWSGNPQIGNPDLIYPGDTIRLAEGADGRPELRLERGMRVVKLSPHARVSAVDGAIPTIRAEVIRHFLTRTRAVPQGMLDGAGYVVSAVDEHLIVGAGDRIHAKGLDGASTLYSIVRAGKLYTAEGVPEPTDLDNIVAGFKRFFSVPEETSVVLGQEAVHVGDAQLEAVEGMLTTLRILRSTREVQIGDRLIPADDNQIERNMHPVAPAIDLEAKVIDVVDGLSQIGQYNAIVIDRGDQHGMRVGDVVAVYQKGKSVRDPYAKRAQDELLHLPDERAALALLFQTFDKISYALVMEAHRAIHVGDMVRNP